MSNKNITQEGVEVKVGQRWKSLDKRDSQRCITIIRVENGFAYYKNKKTVALGIYRMHKSSTGWELYS